MPDTEIRDLSETNTVITACPVLVVDGEPETDGDLMNCGVPLDVTITRTIRGDDYGSWPVYDVGFSCGHTFEDMRKSLRYEDQI